MYTDSKRVRLLEKMRLLVREYLISENGRVFDEIDPTDYDANKGTWAKAIVYSIILEHKIHNRLKIEELLFINDLLESKDYSNYLIAKAIIENEN